MIQINCNVENNPTIAVPHRQVAAGNLKLMLADLPIFLQILLSQERFNFKFSRGSNYGISDYAAKKIFLNLKLFLSFHYQEKAGPNQRFAQFILLEEVAHFVKFAFGLYEDKPWETATQAELSSITKDALDLMAAIRKYYSHDCGHVKNSLDKYSDSAKPNEIFVEIIHAKYYLTEIGYDKPAIDARLSAAFPHTYPLAHKFLSECTDRAAEHIEERPELIGNIDWQTNITQKRSQPAQNNRKTLVTK